MLAVCAYVGDIENILIASAAISSRLFCVCVRCAPQIANNRETGARKNWIQHWRAAGTAFWRASISHVCGAAINGLAVVVWLSGLPARSESHRERYIRETCECAYNTGDGLRNR